MGVPQVDRLDYYGKLAKYLKNYPEKTEFDFTTNEIDFYDDFIKELEAHENIDIVGGVEYLHNCKKYREYFIDKKRLFENSQIDKASENNTYKEADLSNINAVQKVIYLNELGIIDLLRKEHCFMASTNHLAKIITAITGEKQTTIQPYLNALLSDTGAENKHPYYTKKTVEKVQTQLINLGFKPK